MSYWYTPSDATYVVADCDTCGKGHVTLGCPTCEFCIHKKVFARNMEVLNVSRRTKRTKRVGR